MTEPTQQIEPGDIVVDLTSGRTLHVMRKAADRADEWSEQNNYDLIGNYGNSRLGARSSDTVWTCVYANSIQSKPSKDYAFPESRLARIETEAAVGYRVQEEIQFQFAVSMLQYASVSGSDQFTKPVRIVLEAVNEELAERAVEYVEADRGEKLVTDGGTDFSDPGMHRCRFCGAERNVVVTSPHPDDDVYGFECPECGEPNEPNPVGAIDEATSQ